MSVYGNILEDAKTITTINESFSKKDLQDPNTLKRLLNEKHKFADWGQETTFTVGVLSAIVAVCAIPLSFAASPIAFTSLAASIISYLNYKIYGCISNWKLRNSKENKVAEFKYDLLKLKDKCEENIKKDKKNSSKYRSMLSAVEKNLKAIKAYEEKVANEKFMKEVEYCMELYKEFVEWYKNPNRIYGTQEGDYYFLIFKELLKIDDSKLAKKFISNNTKSKITKDELVSRLKYEAITKWYGDDNSDSEEVSKEIDITFDELPDGDLYELLYYNDENPDCSLLKGIVLSSKECYGYKIYIEGDYDIDCDKTNIQLFLDEILVDADAFSKEAIIEADRALGYYRFAPIPEDLQVKPLEL